MSVRLQNHSRLLIKLKPIVNSCDFRHEINQRLTAENISPRSLCAQNISRSPISDAHKRHATISIVYALGGLLFLAAFSVPLNERYTQSMFPSVYACVYTCTCFFVFFCFSSLLCLVKRGTMRQTVDTSVRCLRPVNFRS